jgi:hypothetical protein
MRSPCSHLVLMKPKKEYFARYKLGGVLKRLWELINEAMAYLRAESESSIWYVGF